MDEIALLRALAPGAESPDATARTAALQALEARFDLASATPSSPPVRARRRGFLPLVAAGATAAVVAGILLVGSGPSAEPAAAQALKQTATVAAGSNVPAQAPPGPGQLLYVKTKLVELQGWLPDGPGMGPRANPRYFTTKVPLVHPDAPAALVPTSREFWISRDGAARTRETLGRVDFLSPADQSRWEDAGSPPPFSFDPDEHRVRRDGSGRPLKEFASSQAGGVFLNYGVFPDLSELPTEPEALRRAVERSGGGEAPVTAIGAGALQAARRFDTIERLITILTRPTASPALRAAAFNAFAEIPGTELERDVTDVAGRRGDAIAWEAEADSGFRREFIFDPRTSRVLADAQVLAGKAADEYGVPAGTVFRETAYLQSGVVDSSRERPE